MEYSKTVTKTEHSSHLDLTKDTPYLTLMDNLWVGCSENFGENQPCYEKIAMYHIWYDML